jgi:hypothetical protein
VTVGLRHKGRPVGPQPTTSLGTQRAAWTPSPVGGLSQTRWALARMHWERQAGLGGASTQAAGTPTAGSKPWASPCWPPCWGGGGVITRWCLANPGVFFRCSLRGGDES